MRLLKSKTFTLKSKIVLVALLALTILALPATALAHPLGNFTVNRYSRIEVGSAGVNIFYVLDMAEIPTFQEKDIIDLNKDGQVSQDEQSQYADAKVKQIQSNLKLTINNAPLDLKPVAKDLTFLAGQGGLQTLRLTAHFQTSALPANAANLSYNDTNYADRLGWREIVLRNATGIALTQSNVSNKDQTNELRVYPEDMLASPLSITAANAAFKLDPSIVVNRTDYQQNSEVVKTQDPLANLINGELTLPIVLFALLASVVLGMFHALSPGHGKTVVAAYLVGSRGTARHAIFLGLTVTVTHTIGVFVLGLITLFASQYILPEKLYPWIGLFSGLLVVGMGISLFRSRLIFARSTGNATGGTASLEQAGHSHSPDEHSHSHDESIHSHDEHTHDHDEHDHTHSHQSGDHSHTHDAHEHSHDGHTHDHDHNHSHDEAEIIKVGQPVLEPALVMAGNSAQVIEQPQMRAATMSPSIETVHPHTHDHDQGHSHDHEHNHTPVQPANFVASEHDHGHSHDHDAHEHSHESSLVHSHGGKMHSHLPPGSDGTTVTWKNLLIFGISAGLLPCPSALVLMLSAIALNRTALGLIMIVFFSMGLAGTLTLIGLLLVYAREKLGGMKLGKASKLIRLLPIVSAALVAILGLAITYEGLIQIGLLK